MLRRLARDGRGVTVIEFAVTAPVMLMLVMGMSDLAYRAYAQAMLEGAVQKAGRDSALEGGDGKIPQIDAKVLAMVQNMAKDATYTTSRKSYSTFSNVRPEKFTDGNANGVREVGECYEDVNNNSQWDPDSGKTGQGGADDIVQYEVTVTYPRIFPLAQMLGWPKNQVIKAKTLLKNQPYASQNIPTPVTRCS